MLRAFNSIPCAIYTPNDLAAMLRQLLQLQNDPSQFEAFKNANLDVLQSLALATGKQFNNISIDTHDFISRHEAQSLLKEYRHYYSEYEKEIHAQFTHGQEKLATNKQTLALSNQLLKTTLMAGAIATLRNTFILQGVSKQRVDAIINLVLLIVPALAADSYQPFLYALMIDKLSSLLPRFSGKDQLQTILTIASAILHSDTPFTAFTIGKLAATSLLAGLATRTVNNIFSIFSNRFSQLNNDAPAQPQPANGPARERVYLFHIYHGTPPY